jgi:Tetratricopeptide repeat
MFGRFRSFVRTRSSAVSATQSSQPSAEDPFQTRGDELSQNSDYNGAVVMYDAALKIRKTDPVLLLSRSLAYMMSTPPRLDLALQDADTALRYDSSNCQGWLQKGKCHLKNGDINQAEEAFVKAVTFARGTDRLAAQTSLADVRARRTQLTTEPSSVPVQSTPPTNPPDPTTTRVPIPRPINESSGSQIPATNPPINLGDLVGLTPEAPPGYSPNITSSDPSVRTLSLTSRLTQMTTSLTSKTKGSLSIRPHTAPGGIDAVRLYYIGMTTLELTDREYGTLTFLHPSFCKYIFLISLH